MDIPEFNFETKLVVSLRTSPELAPRPRNEWEGKWDPGPLTEVLRVNPQLHDQLANAIKEYQDANPREPAHR